jgi:glycosyltransferase involved in cell wall biosynthesis
VWGLLGDRQTTRILLLSFVPLDLSGAGTARLTNELVNFLTSQPKVQLETCTFGSVNQARILDESTHYEFAGLPLKFLHDLSPSMIRHVMSNYDEYDAVLILGSSVTFSIIQLLLRIFRSKARVVQIPQRHRGFVYRDIVANLLYQTKRWIIENLLTFKITQPILIVYSPEEQHMVERFARKVIVRPLGIRVNKVTNLASTIESQSALKDLEKIRPLRLIHVGDIHRNKLPLFTIDVVSVLNDKLQGKLELIAIGRIHSGYFRNVKSSIDKAHLQSIIRFAGLVDEYELVKLWKSGDIFVLFSNSEASPHTVFESMALGVPVVATRVGIIPELEKEGLLLAVNYGDVEEMVRKILILNSNKTYRTNLVERAKNGVKQYDISKFLQTLDNVLFLKKLEQ